MTEPLRPAMGASWSQAFTGIDPTWLDRDNAGGHHQEREEEPDNVATGHTTEPCPEPQSTYPDDQEGPPGSFEEMAWRVHCAVEDMFPMLDAALVRSVQVESPSLQHAIDTLLSLAHPGQSTGEADDVVQSEHPAQEAGAGDHFGSSALDGADDRGGYPEDGNEMLVFKGGAWRQRSSGRFAKREEVEAAGLKWRSIRGRDEPSQKPGGSPVSPVTPSAPVAKGTPRPFAPVASAAASHPQATFPVEEDFKPITEAEMDQDPLMHVLIVKLGLKGQVKKIERGVTSGQLLYLIKYEDGDQEYLTAARVVGHRMHLDVHAELASAPDDPIQERQSEGTFGSSSDYSRRLQFGGPTQVSKNQPPPALAAPTAKAARAKASGEAAPAGPAAPTAQAARAPRNLSKASPARSRFPVAPAHTVALSKGKTRGE